MPAETRTAGADSAVEGDLVRFGASLSHMLQQDEPLDPSGKFFTRRNGNVAIGHIW